MADLERVTSFVTYGVQLRIRATSFCVASCRSKPFANLTVLTI